MLQEETVKLERHRNILNQAAFFYPQTHNYYTIDFYLIVIMCTRVINELILVFGKRNVCLILFFLLQEIGLILEESYIISKKEEIIIFWVS